MKHGHIKSDQIRADLIGLADHIALDNIDAAMRFLDAADAAFEMLAENPGIGREREFSNPSLRGLRSWPIRGFTNYTIFYRPTDSGIEVIRIIHGHRDVDSLLADSP